MDRVALFGTRRLFGVALLFAGSLIPSLTQAQCVPVKEADSTHLKYHLPASCSAEEKERYSIPAAEVVESVKSGKAVDIENAVVRDSFTLRSVNVGEEISIKKTTVVGRVDWSYATFKAVLVLHGTMFEKEANFSGATVEKDMFLDRATFQGEATFLDLKLAGVLYGRALTFKKNAIFSRALLGKGVLFRETTVFEGETDFVSARFGGNAEFTRAVFKRRANFNSAHIEGAAFFNPATFEGEASFVSARFGRTAEFTRALFKDRARFHRARIEESAFFSFTTFNKELSLYGASVSGDLFLESPNLGSEVNVDLRGFI